MRSDSQLADTTDAVARAVLAVFIPLLREEEIAEAYREVAQRVRPVLARYAEKHDRMAKRLDPLGGGS